MPSQDIIDWLIENDAQNDPTIRQYGIVDLLEGGRSAAFTGENCSDFKGHKIGDTYAIQGNILLGQSILDDMEEAFLTQYGTFEEKLMASLMAANVVGADTRCTPYGLFYFSFIFAFQTQMITETICLWILMLIMHL